MGSCEAFPSDLIFEILSRTSLGTLDQCKEVSNSWKKMIYEPTFLPLHCKNSNCLFGYFFQEVRGFRYTKVLVGEGAAAVNRSWPFDDMKILAASYEGILCCRRLICRNYQYYACKPTTNQWQELPDPIIGDESHEAFAVVVVDSDPLRYVILRLSTESTCLGYNCEIFDSAIWEWEKIERDRGPKADIISPKCAGVTIGHSVYWLTLYYNVLSFDVDKRRYRRFRLPEAVESCERKQLVEYEGGLGLICSRVEGGRNEMELWLAVERQGGRRRRWRRRPMQWRRKMVVDMTRVGDLKPIEFCSSKVLFMNTCGEAAAFYNLENCSISRVEVPCGLVPQQIFRFRSDFEPVRLKGGQ